MARKIELKVVNGAGPSFAYGEIMAQILHYARPGVGLTLDQVLAAVEALKPLDAAISEGRESVTFTEGQWATLKEKLEVFPFAVAMVEIAEFGLAIRNAPEIT